METAKSLGYVKGLIDGLGLDENAKETKVIKAIVDVLENIVDDLDDIRDDIEYLDESVDDLEDEVYGDDDDEWDDDDYEEFATYEVECPSCNAVFEVDEDTLLEGAAECPVCGESLEFEFEEEEDDEDEDENEND